MYNKGVVNLGVSFITKSKEFTEQVQEEIDVKKAIAKLLHDMGYKFCIAGEEVINAAYIKGLESLPKEEQ